MRSGAATSVGWVAVCLAAIGLVRLHAQSIPMTEIPLDSGGPGLAPVAASSGGPEAVAFDGTAVWVAKQFTNTVVKLDRTTGAQLGTVTVGDRPVALLRIGNNLWVANLESDTLSKLRTSDGAVLGTFSVA